MSEQKVFYYHFKPFNFWLLLNVVMTLVFGYCCARCNLLYTAYFYILIVLMIYSWGAWIFKHFFKQRLALITDEYIQIDHSQPLFWKDVVNAEEKIVKCGFKEFKLIILNAKSDIKYKYNLLQKCVDPFSLPLYDVIKKEDAVALQNITADKVKYISLSENKEH